MKYFYGEYDGSEFPTQDKLFGFDQLMQFILQHGEQAMKAIEQMMKDPKDEEQSDLLEQLLKDGMLDKDGKGKLRLTPRAVTKMQRKALMEVFANLRDGQREGHEKVTAGPGRRTHRRDQAVPVRRPRLRAGPAPDAAQRADPPRPAARTTSAKIKFDEQRLRAAPARGRDELLDRRPARHERLDDALRAVPVGQEGRDGDAGAGPREVPAGLDRLRRLLLRRRQDPRGRRCRWRCPSR